MTSALSMKAFLFWIRLKKEEKKKKNRTGLHLYHSSQKTKQANLLDAEGKGLWNGQQGEKKGKEEN